ncbi:hypothetical protein MIZ03_4691 [Rhodoferax lithotrophicus]|uniref:Uncharacterized protein n=1 Tax=Rhodoferax lithotrophicus TaxID=2798804 RepID=A0ABM7MTN6_9BURK|nr:hypothetical protein MIZ03_4691 [Rhodoferax sp. MIZ03]
MFVSKKNPVHTCPVCSHELRRIPRSTRMRFSIGSVHLICNGCHRRFLKTLFGSFKFLGR